MPTLTPPSEQWAWPTGNPLLDRIKLTRGLALVHTGGQWVTSSAPWQGDLNGLTEGVDYFMGGRIYTITSAQATALTAAGWGSLIT